MKKISTKYKLLTREETKKILGGNPVEPPCPDGKVRKSCFSGAYFGGIPVTHNYCLMPDEPCAIQW